MDKYSNLIVDSTTKYLYNLQYLGNNDNKTLNHLIDLQILNKIIDWMKWMKYTETSIGKLEKIIYNIVNSNGDLVYFQDITNKSYKNVNNYQTIWTWQRVYDNFEVKTIDNL